MFVCSCTKKYAACIIYKQILVKKKSYITLKKVNEVLQGWN